MSEGRSDPAKRTTIYDIAEMADTSASAVSSILNGTWRKRRISQRLADKVTRIAERVGYSANTQASLLRRARSNIVGMIVPKYDNRYFGAIAEQFEAMARERGLFPVVTCTQRAPAFRKPPDPSALGHSRPVPDRGRAPEDPKRVRECA